MTTLRVLLALSLFVAAPAAAQAQNWQPRAGELVVDPHRYQADQHRMEMDRLRARADQRETFTRQLELEARLNRQQIEAARLPVPVLPPPLPALGSPGEERAFRRSASERRPALTREIDEIDAWLDRPRD
jgi:hypothetical protein